MRMFRYGNNKARPEPRVCGEPKPAMNTAATLACRPVIRGKAQKDR